MTRTNPAQPPTHSNADLFPIMRTLQEEADRLQIEGTRLSAPFGQIPVGSAFFDPFLKAEIIRVFLSSLRDSRTPRQAYEDAKAAARDLVVKHNGKRKDINWRRGKSTGEAFAVQILHRVKRALSLASSPREEGMRMVYRVTDCSICGKQFRKGGYETLVSFENEEKRTNPEVNSDPIDWDCEVPMDGGTLTCSVRCRKIFEREVRAGRVKVGPETRDEDSRPYYPWVPKRKNLARPRPRQRTVPYEDRLLPNQVYHYLQGLYREDPDREEIVKAYGVPLKRGLGLRRVSFKRFDRRVLGKLVEGLDMLGPNGALGDPEWLQQLIEYLDLKPGTWLSE